MKEQKKYIFVSYSSKDKRFVNRLINRLLDLDIKIWFDVFEIKIGDSIIEKINEALDRTEGIAIILSRNSIKSNWVKKEINTTLIRKLNKKKIDIFPILIDDCTIPNLLTEYKYADFRENFDSGFNNFIDSLKWKKYATKTDEHKTNISFKTPIVRFRNLSQKYNRIYPKFVRELILLADVILEIILEIYKNNIEKDFVEDWTSLELPKEAYIKGKGPKIERPRIRMKTAELIIDRVISDYRSEHEGLDLLKGSDSNYKIKLAKDIIHFDVNLFLSKKVEWSFSGIDSRDLKSFYNDNYFKNYDFFNTLFNRIIPSQFYAAYKRFAIKCTEDFSSNDSKLFFQYLISDYKLIDLLKISKKELKEIWAEEYSNKFNLRTLIFCERVGKFHHAFFGKYGIHYLEITDELLYSALQSAFKENNTDSITFPSFQ